MNAQDFLASTDEVLKENLTTILSNIGGQPRTMTLQDHLKGRPSEIGYINGLVVRKGRVAKIPTPSNEAIAYLDKEIEQGKLKPSLSNLPIFEQYLMRAS